jgi:hypothetical protein
MCAYALRCETAIDDFSLASKRSHNDPISKCFHLADNCLYARPVRVVFYLDQPPLNAEGSVPARMDSAQPPTFPPFIEHAVNDEVNAPANVDIIVGDYHIDGVADIIGVESRRHVIAFYEATTPLLKKASKSNRLMTQSKFEVIKEALLCNHEGGEFIAELRSEYPQI